jgi:hypothetical protein
MLKRSESCPQSLFLTSKPITLQARPKPNKKVAHSIVVSKSEDFPYPDPEDFTGSHDFDERISELKTYVAETRKQELLKSFKIATTRSQTSLHRSNSSTTLQKYSSREFPQRSNHNVVAKKHTSFPCVHATVEFPKPPAVTESSTSKDSPLQPKTSNKGQGCKVKGPVLHAHKQQIRVTSAGSQGSKPKKVTKSDHQDQNRFHSHHVPRACKKTRPLSAII